MQKNLLIKTVFIVAVLLVFAYGIFGIPKSFSPEGLKEAMLQRVHLGLDLRGGTHLILQVMVNDAINADSELMIERLKSKLAGAHVSYAEISKPDPQHPETIVIKGVSPDSAGTVRDLLSDLAGEYEVSSGPENSFVLTMKPSIVDATKKDAVTQAINTIRNRIDELGVSEPLIQEHGLGDYQILVQLPGVDDPARVKGIIQNTAMLELKQSFGGPFKSEAEALQANNGVLPPNTMIMKGVPERDSGDTGDVYYVVSRSSVVSGRDLRGKDAARVTTDQSGRPAVDFFLTNEGGKRFAAFTGAHIKDNLAIVLDNRVRSAPRIDGEISDTGIITGRFTQQQASDLAMVLSSGALPAGIRYLEERTVGPSLGADSIRHGVTAAIIGMAVVMVFMLIYYKAAGINADLALVLNLVILLGFMGMFGAVLTLPGIAGIILTIGMGVDSNVLIFERIREELRTGKSPAAAVDQGFGKAWLTIIDTHVTTVVSAIILFMVASSGPVRGFALTLMLGLVANVFTAVFVSRVIFDAALNRKQRGQGLSI